MTYTIKDITRNWRDYEPDISDLEDIFDVDAWDKDRLRDYFDQVVGIYAAIDEHGELAGYVSTELHDRFDLYIWTIIVDTAYQGKGVGRSLVKHVKELAANRNIVLHVRRTNTPAINLYKSEGFVETGLQNYRYSDGAAGVELTFKGRK